MIVKFLKAISGLFIMPLCIRIFNPDKIFKGKRIAVIGAASSAYEKELGEYIDSFDIVIRVNKALTTWRPENELFIGTKTDILFHSFYENNLSGGGPLDFQLFEKRKVKYVVNPINNKEGWRLNYNFYKKYNELKATYLLSNAYYREIVQPFNGLKPTVGYAALYSILKSPFKEVYITGFTFFKTPYGKGYRDDLVDMEANKRHIAAQGLHDPDIEFREFLKMLERNKGKSVILDDTLRAIVANN
jgi:hypothetical protein